MKIGIDIVHIERIRTLLADKNAMAKAFGPNEITDDPLRLAGWFAAKEAYFKAAGKKGDWLGLAVAHEESGRPFFIVFGQRDNSINLSISHDGDYAIAIVIIEN